MSSFYSILYAVTNPVIMEQLSVGLIFSGSGNVFYKFSTEKVRPLKTLLPGSAYQLLRDSLRNIQLLAEDTNKSKHKQELNLNYMELVPS
ncbi:MAG: hypothetical protein K9I94_03750 [Bacteroidales bacterium]|nr:hypothetical protein [Bacteroidales bacterium]